MNVTINTLNLTINVNSLVDAPTAINKELTSAISSVLNQNTNKAYFDQLELGSYIESEGGYYTGLIRSDYDHNLYAIFLAPNGIGDNNGEEKAIHSSNVTITGTDYLSDGWKNTTALVEFNGDLKYAGGWSRSLNINGKTDWYIPSRDELEMCYRVYKPDTTANYTGGYNPNGDANCSGLSGGSGTNLNSVPTGTTYTDSFPTQTHLTDFKTGGSQAFINAWYWSSTQSCTYTAHSWSHYFSSGCQTCGRKHYECNVRAVRRVLVQE